MSEEVKELGISEILEALTSIEKIAVAGAKVYSDGKISTSDLTVLVDLAKDSGAILEGFQDLDLAKEQAKNLNEEEVIQIVVKVMSVVKAIKDAK